jgi:hypothetical protein
MKLLLVLDSADLSGRISDKLKILGFDTVWYRHVLKAMDNVEEIAPSGVFVSAADFPRHWKTLVSFVRICLPASVCPIVVLHDERFAEKEIEKARYLGVDCLLPDTGMEVPSFECLIRVFKHLIPPGAWMRGVESYRAGEKQIAMIITNPFSGALVPGKIKKITNFGAIWMADHPNLTRNLAPNTELRACSLRVGGAILSPECKIIDNDEALSLEFISFPPKEKIALEKFLMSIKV